MSSPGSVTLPYAVHGPWPPARPVLLSVPHAGRTYPPTLLARARVSLSTLQRLEDRAADLLIDASVTAGFTVIVATVPRALIDLNRAVDDCDPAAFLPPPPGLRPSQRARAGLGLLPTRLAPEGMLWRAPLPVEAHAELVATYHAPYHAAIASCLTAIQSRWGAALLLDVHSMPMPANPVDIVIGDRYGQTAGAQVADRLLAIAEGRGFAGARNHPYAGAFTIIHHGRPARAIEAAQIEIARPLYLNVDGQIVERGRSAVAAMLADMAAGGETLLRERAIDWPIAAE